MKIIEDYSVATDLGPRRIIRVCLNPQDPESVHPDGSPHTGQPPAGTTPGLKPWEWCHDCRYNWVIREFTWTGDQLYTHAKDGTRGKAKTNTQLLAEMKQRLDRPTPPANPSILNATL